MPVFCCSKSNLSEQCNTNSTKIQPESFRKSITPVSILAPSHKFNKKFNFATKCCHDDVLENKYRDMYLVFIHVCNTYEFKLVNFAVVEKYPGSALVVGFVFYCRILRFLRNLIIYLFVTCCLVFSRVVRFAWNIVIHFLN